MSYQTIRAYTRVEWVERKSRFIGHVAPVASEEEAMAFVAEISGRHRDATHNVYAYRLRAGLTERYSDDGEPQGTAGVPCLNVLQKADLTDICTVVTRYFGGILLGGGGLVRAYSKSVTLALDAAEILLMQPCIRVEISCEYTHYGKLQYLLPDYRVQILKEDFTDRVTVTLAMRKERLPGLETAVRELTGGQSQCLVLEEYMDAME